MSEKKEEQIPFKEFIKEIWHVCWHAPTKLKRGLLLCFIGIGATAAFDGFLPVISGHLTNLLKDAISLHVLTGILVFWTLFYVVFRKFEDFFEQTTQMLAEIVYQRYDFLIRLYKIKTAFEMPTTLVSSAFKQKMIASIPRLGHWARNTLYNLLWVIFQQVSFLCAFVALLCYAPVFAVTILSVTIVQGGLLFYINNRLKEKEETFTKEEMEANTRQQDALENIGNIQMLNIGKQEIKNLDEVQEKYFRTFFDYNIKQTLWGLISNVLDLICRGLVIYMSMRWAVEQQDIGAYVALSGLGATMLKRGEHVMSRYRWLHNYGIQYITLNKELSYDKKLLPKRGHHKITGHGDIILDRVCFTYPEEKEPVLQDLSLKIKSGSRVAIIGNSGMGKSTLINVMKHAYEIQSGTVFIDGVDVRKLSQESLCKCLTYVDQHPTFWNQKNIKENLLMFNPKATDVELYQALKAANLLKELTKKEKGIESKVTALSAGQKQRLSLARALLRHTPLIIMDEPTANLDTHAQTKVLEGIKNLSKVKGQKPTVIFASNVPAEIASANRILLLENGQIVEDGTPKKLMTNENSKTYKRLKKYKALFEE